MSRLKTVSADQFRKILSAKRAEHVDRAVAILNNFGPRLSYDVQNVILHAVDKGKEKEHEVLTILERHWNEELQFQHPDIRGTVESMPGVNQTQQTFLRIYQETLALTPTATAT